MRASLNGSRTSMMELLVSYGADLNAAWHGSYPIIFASCETLDPTALDWLCGMALIPTVVTSLRGNPRASHIRELRSTTCSEHTSGIRRLSMHRSTYCEMLVVSRNMMSRVSSPRSVVIPIQSRNSCLETILLSRGDIHLST